MRKLIALLTAIALTAIVLGTAGRGGADRNRAGAMNTSGTDSGTQTPTTCVNGFSWGQYDHYALPGVGSSLSGTIRENSHSTASGDHVIGRYGFQATAGYPEIQTGIWAENGGSPRFYVEEVGAANPDPNTWEDRGWVGTPWPQSYHFYEHFWNVGSAPADGTYYSFTITHTANGTGTQSFKAAGPSYTSPTITLPTLTDPDSTATNEINLVCPDSPIASYDFASMAPYTTSQYTFSTHNSADPSFFTAIVNSTALWVDYPVIDCLVHGTRCGAPPP
jgi:hypothetical protein